MAMRPTFLNAVVAWLFIIGSACFVVGSVPAYLNAVGGVADSVTFVIGSIFFTAASLGQLLQAQTPAQRHVRGADHRAVAGDLADLRLDHPQVALVHAGQHLADEAGAGRPGEGQAGDRRPTGC